MIAWEMDASTRMFLRVSDTAETVLGYPSRRWQEAPGFWIGILHPEDRERVARAFWQVMREGGGCEIEYRVVAADGRVVRLKDRVRVIADPAGRVRVLQGATVDVSPPIEQPAGPDRVGGRRWRRSRRSNHVLTPVPFVPPVIAPERSASVQHAFSRERLVDELGEAVIASDAAHRVVYWNKAAERLLGWTADEAFGRSDGELLNARTDSGQTAEIIASMLAHRPWSAEVVVKAKDGSSIPVRITASALRGPDSGVAGYVAVVTDLRDSMRGAERREAATAMDAVAALAKGVSREIGEGVGRVEAALRNALSRLPAGDPGRAQLDEALRTVDATAALAGQLLAVGRGVGVAMAEADLREVVRSSLPALELLAGPAIEIATEIEALDQLAAVDPSVASQVLLHLAANACAGMPDGGKLVVGGYAAEISRRTASRDVPAGQWVVLEVRDTRSRMPVSVERMFEPYAEDQSAGLGLAAAHGLVTASGGWLTAEPGEDGLIFRVWLRPA